MDELEAVRATLDTIAGCECCQRRAMAVKRVCRACYLAAMRRVAKGEPWDAALEAVKASVARRARGWVR